MKIQLYKILLGIIFLLFITGCKKVPDGFISENIRYEENPILVPKGRTYVSSALNFDGSTKPGIVKILHIYDKDGKLADSIFQKKYTIKGWKQKYDNLTDTTPELVAAKQFDMEVAPININETSGQLEANFTTSYLTSGTYSFDLQISNSAGTKTYPKIGAFTIETKPPYEAQPELGTYYVRMSKVGDENTATNLTTQQVSIKWIDNGKNVVVLKFVDKNGVAFNPQNGEILRRPNGNTYLQTLQDYAYKSVMYNDRIEFYYAANPFPLASLGNGYNVYYRIPGQFFKHDNATQFPAGQWNANPRLPFRAYSPGTYEITFKMPDITHT